MTARVVAFVSVVFVLCLVAGTMHLLGGTDGKPLSPEAPKHEAVQAANAREQVRLEQVTLVEQRISAGRRAAHFVAEAERRKALRLAEDARKRRAAMERRTVTGTTQPHTAPSRSGVDWDAIARCESEGRWNLNTGNGYYGGLQFALGSWRSVGGTGYPHEHSRETQIAMAERLSNGGRNLRHWPVCGRHG